MLNSGLTMADFPSFDYTMQQVVRAGDALRNDLVWSEGRREELLEVFCIANQWRDSHLYPMNRLRHEVIGKMRARNLPGITAARLKRMPSIRTKLRRISSKLNRIQDLGGCRAVLSSIADAGRLLDAYSSSPRHEFHSKKDYVAEPKLGGYRSHHLIYRYLGAGDDEVFTGRRIELQIRTRLQHSWATAVEAVGLLRREDMKAGEGNADWLRLFDLISAEFAMAEKCPEPPHLPPHKERAKEIRDLNKKLNALNTLENFRHAVNFVNLYAASLGSPQFYRIEYNHAEKTVAVLPHSRPIGGVKDYEDAEMRDSVSGDGNINTVFVEADKLEDIRAAYPNYFGDVQLFCHNLKAITDGRPAREYTMPPLESVPRPPAELPDLSWFRKPKRWF